MSNDEDSLRPSEYSSDKKDLIVNFLALCTFLTFLILVESELSDRFLGPFLTSLPEAQQVFKPFSQEVVVVRIGGDPVSDEEIRENWPPSYTVLRDLIRRSWCLGGRGIFVDVTLTKTRGRPTGDEEDGLVELAQDAALISGEKGSDAERAQFRQEVCRSDEVHANELPPRMVVLFATPLYSAAQKALAGHFADTSIVDSLVPAFWNEQKAPPVAYKVAQELCAEGDERACISFNDGRPFLIRDTLFSTSEQQSVDADFKIKSSDCIYSDPQLGAQVINWFRVFGKYFLAMILGADTALDLQCPPKTTISSSFFSGAYADTIRPYVSGKFVVVGSVLPILGDVHRTRAPRPIHGVYLIAESINQALTRNYDFSRRWPYLFVRFFSLFGAVALLQWISIQLRLHDRQSTLTTKRRYCALLSLAGGAVMLDYYLPIDPYTLIRDTAFVFITVGLEFDPLGFLFQRIPEWRNRTQKLLVNISEKQP